AMGPPIRFLGKSATGKGEDESRSRQVEKSKGFVSAKELIYDAILRRSTDVHLEPKPEELSIRYRIDGVMYPAEPFDRTVEDPVEYKMNNVTQIEINTKAGQTFAGSLRSILRQDPDIVMVGEIRDDETARIGCQAANTGHMVFSTVHANDTISALYRLIDL